MFLTRRKFIQKTIGSYRNNLLAYDSWFWSSHFYFTSIWETGFKCWFPCTEQDDIKKIAVEKYWLCRNTITTNYGTIAKAWPVGLNVSISIPKYRIHSVFPLVKSTRWKYIYLSHSDGSYISVYNYGIAKRRYINLPLGNLLAKRIYFLSNTLIHLQEKNEFKLNYVILSNGNSYVHLQCFFEPSDRLFISCHIMPRKTACCEFAQGKWSYKIENRIFDLEEFCI